MSRRFVASSLAAALLSLAGAARGDTFLVADLTNANEVPPAVPTLLGGDPRPASYGTATFVLNAAMTQMSMHIEVYNIDVGAFFGSPQTADNNDNLTLAHIHGSGTVTPTTTAGVVWGFIGSPFNDTNPTDTDITPFESGVGGTITSVWNMSEGQNTTLTDQIPNILAGRTYLNFHTVQFGGGEIRGHLIVIPEAASLGILGMGVLGLLVRRRR